MNASDPVLPKARCHVPAGKEPRFLGTVKQKPGGKARLWCRVEQRQTRRLPGPDGARPLDGRREAALLPPAVPGAGPAGPRPPPPSSRALRGGGRGKRLWRPKCRCEGFGGKSSAPAQPPGRRNGGKGPFGPHIEEEPAALDTAQNKHGGHPIRGSTGGAAPSSPARAAEERGQGRRGADPAPPACPSARSAACALKWEVLAPELRFQV